MVYLYRLRLGLERKVVISIRSRFFILVVNSFKKYDFEEKGVGVKWTKVVVLGIVIFRDYFLIT